ncbi:hypothetical protein E2I00_006444, partial [Balaenoptera physalus]
PGNPFLQEKVPEAHLHPGARSVLSTVSCGGDGSGERGPLVSPTEAEIPVSRPPPYPDYQTVPILSWRKSPWSMFLPHHLLMKSLRGLDAGVGQPANNLTPVHMGEEEDLARGSAEDESESQDVGDEYEVPTPRPNPGMDVVGGHGVLASSKGEDLEEKKEELESTVRNSPWAADEECRISRDKRGVDKGMFPFYYLYLEAADGRKVRSGSLGSKSHLPRAKRGFSPTQCQTWFFPDETRTEVLLRCSKSNVLGTKFTIFDNGVNPERKNFVPETARIREELGAVCYETNVLGFRGPRKMTVIIPGIDAQNQRISVQPQNEQESLLSRLQRGASQGLVLLQNKAPSWSDESGAYVLNFHGRVTRTSVKNFQIMHPDDPDYLVLQFGRVAPDTFTMDFRFPLCPLQAFAICLSSFDGKLA